jgi:hypothetical protein
LIHCIFPLRGCAGAKNDKPNLVISSRNGHFNIGLGDDHAPGLPFLNSLKDHLSIHAFHSPDFHTLDLSALPGSGDYLLLEVNPQKLRDVDTFSRSRKAFITLDAIKVFDDGTDQRLDPSWSICLFPFKWTEKTFLFIRLKSKTVSLIAKSGNGNSFLVKNKITFHQAESLRSKWAGEFHGDGATTHFGTCEPAHPPRNITAKALKSAWGGDNAWGNQLFHLHL